MPTITELVADTQDQILTTLKQGQDAVVDGLRSISGSVEGFVPFVDQLPDPTHAVNSAFAFAQSLLAGQREFVDSVLGAVLPSAKPAPKASTKSAKATSANA